MDNIMQFGFYKNLLIEAGFNRQKAESLMRSDEPESKDPLAEKQRCNYCGGTNTEILHFIGYGVRNGYDNRKYEIDYFKLHCLKCLKTYDFKPEKPSVMIQQAVNPVPFFSSNFRKERILPMVMELKAIRTKKQKVMNRKLAIKNIEHHLARYLEINTPMVFDNNWLIVKDKFGQVRIYEDKDVYYRAESFYQNFVKPNRLNKAGK